MSEGTKGVVTERIQGGEDIQGEIPGGRRPPIGAEGPQLFVCLSNKKLTKVVAPSSGQNCQLVAKIVNGGAI